MIKTVATGHLPSDQLAPAIKALRSKNGATRARLQSITGRASAPDAWHLKRMAKRYGFKLDTRGVDAQGLTLYRFVAPAKKPAAPVIADAAVARG